MRPEGVPSAHAGAADLKAVAALDLDGVLATALGENGIDYVARYFAPAAGIPEARVKGAGDVDVRVWNGRSCEPEAVLQNAPMEPSAIAFSPAGSLAAAGRSDGTVRVWDSKGHMEAILRDYPSPIWHIGFDSDGALFVTTGGGSRPSSVIIQNLQGGPRRAYEANQFMLFGVVIDRKRHRVLASSNDHNVWVWDDRTGGVITKLEGDGPLLELQLSPDGAILVASGGQSPVAWKADDFSKIGSLVGHLGATGMGYFLTDTLLVTASLDGTARVWDVPSQRTLLAFPGVNTVNLSADRSSVFFSGSGGSRIWRPPVPMADVR